MNANQSRPSEHGVVWIERADGQPEWVDVTLGREPERLEALRVDAVDRATLRVELRGPRGTRRTLVLVGPKPAYDLGALGTRRRAVLGLAAAGHTVAAIAELLGISAHTVRTHLKALYRKTGAGSRVELARLLALDAQGAR